MSFQNLLRAAIRRRVREKLDSILPFLRPGDRIADVGTGNGVLCELLRSRRFDVTPIDIADKSIVPGVQPVIYDGEHLPFEDDHFDVALAITVLHHTKDPDTILAEMSRVARRLIVIEEIYDSTFQRYATYAIDSLFNLEFVGHPRTNRTDAGWRQAFDALGLRVVEARYWRSAGVLRRVTYSVTRNR